MKPLPFWGIPSVMNQFFEITIEMLNYCANKCPFCCVASTRKPRKMQIEDLQIILDKIPNFKGTVNLSNNGDPVLLDDLPERIKMIKSAWPECKVHLTSTLAIRRDRSYFQRLFDNGLDELLLSCYAFDAEDYKIVHGSNNFAYVLENIGHILEINKKTPLSGRFRHRYLFDINQQYPVDNHKDKKEIFRKPLENAGLERVYDEDSVIPMDGAVAKGVENNWPWPVPCHIVWGLKAGRCEIHANLDVVPCCLFPGEEYTFGNLRHNTMQEIYTSEKAQAFRNAHWKGEFGKIPVCKTCQCPDMRVSNTEERDRIVAWMGWQLRGKKALFWGAGTAWRLFGSFFTETRPVAMIIDSFYGNQPSEIDNIPVVAPDVLLRAV